jgi:MobA/VirD2-like, nuclease domain
MIPKGNQRGGGQRLATHLLNAYDNDNVEVAEVRGAIAQDLHGAFAEWYAEAKATKCRKYLYSLSVNPDHSQGPYTREHYYDFIRRVEAGLGLKDQPRAVVFHVKHGREHCHIVWSRIDTEKGKAVQISHDHQKLRSVAQEYAKDHNLTLPPGMRKDRGKARFAFRAAAENLAEKQQEERSGISKQERREQITKAWKDSTDATTFVRALEGSGFLLARGDQRAYVVVDLFGEIHSLSRQLQGVKAKELKARLASYDLDKLPAATRAQSYARERRQALLLDNRKREAASKKTSLAERTAAAKATAQERRDELQKAHAARRAELAARRLKLAGRHDAERKALSDLQNARNEEIARTRAANQPKGLLALLGRVTGFNALAAFRHNWQDRSREKEYAEQKAALARRHAREMENFKHQERGLVSLEKRERRSLETGLRREVFRSIAAPANTKPVARELTPEEKAKAEKIRNLAEEFRRASTAAGTSRSPDLTSEQVAKIAAFRRASREIVAPAGKKMPAKGGATKKPPHTPKPAADEAGGKAVQPAQNISEKFNEKAAKPEERPLREIKETAREITEKERKLIDLAREFRERAGQTSPQKERDREGHDSGGDSRGRHYRKRPPDYFLRR